MGGGLSSGTSAPPWVGLHTQSEFGPAESRANKNFQRYSADWGGGGTAVDPPSATYHLGGSQEGGLFHNP